jgi:hypothetical protein
MLNPSLLLFLPLALVPVILHLITLHRLRTVELPTFRFLMDSYLQQRRKARLLEWLLLLLRTAFVALIVITLARPVVESSAWFGGGRGGRDVVLIVDTGVSMSLRTAGTTSMERARAAAAALVKLAGPEDRVTIIAAGQQPRVVLSRFAHDREGILAELDSLQPGLAAGNMALALQQALGDTARRNRSLYLVTDGNRAAWSSLQRQSIAGALKATQSSVVVLDVGPREPVANLAILGDAPAGSQAVAGLPVLFTARIVNQSTAPADATLAVIIDDQTVAQHNLSLQPGQILEQPLSVTPSKPGVAQVRLQLPADSFPEDDSFLLSLNVERRLTVLVLRPEPKSKDEPDPALYLRAALSHGPSVDVRVAAPPQLTTALLAEADAVIVADVDLDEERGRLLRAYAASGGGLLIMPGPHVQPERYRKFLFDGKGANVPPLALQLLAAVGDPDDETQFMPLTAIDLDHPVLGAFADRSANFFSTTRLFRWFPIDVGPDAAARVKPLIRLPDRTPVLVETAIGPGRVLMASFPATPQWSNLPLKPEFVPLLLRAASWLRRAPAAIVPSVVKAHQPGVIALNPDWSEAHVEAIDPDGKTHPVELHRDDNRRLGAMLRTDRKGYYRFRVTPAQGKGGSDLACGFAVNLDLDGQHLAMLDEQAMRDLLGVPQAPIVRGTADDPTLAAQLAGRREMWRAMIWIAFAVITLEFLLSTLRPRQRATIAGSPVIVSAPRVSWFDRIQSLAGQRWSTRARSSGRSRP